MKLLNRWLTRFKCLYLNSFSEEEGIFLDYSSRVEIPVTCRIALVSPYAEVSGPLEKAFAYLSLSEINETSPHFAGLPAEVLIAFKPRWKSWLVEISHPRWEELFEKEIAYALEKGFSNFFVDTVDGVEELCSARPSQCFLYRKAVRKLLERLRRLSPGKIFVNRGLSVYREIADLIDGVLIESFFFDVDGSGWRKRGSEEMEWLWRRVEEFLEDGKEIYALDYAPEARAKQGILRKIALRRGVIWDVAD